MPYRFLDDIAIADIAFEATGKSLNEVFQSAADATLAVMLEDASALEFRQQRTIQLINADAQELLYQFLQEILFFKDADCLLLKVTTLAVVEDGGQFWLSAELAGEEVDIQRHHLNVDVKAVTYHMFTFRKTNSGYLTTVVLDI